MSSLLGAHDPVTSATAAGAPGPRLGRGCMPERALLVLLASRRLLPRSTLPALTGACSMSFPNGRDHRACVQYL